MREKILKDKEKNLNSWTKGRRDEDDYFEKLMKDSKGIDKELL